MRELLESAAKRLYDYAETFSQDDGRVLGISGLARELDKLAETADLHDKLWAAAQAVDLAERAFQDCDDPDLWGALIEPVKNAEQTLAAICRKVAETET